MELVRQKAYRGTFELACRDLMELPLERHLQMAGLDYREDGGHRYITIPTFDETIDLIVPGFTFANAGGANVTLTTKIIILHYIIHASGAALSGELVPYEDIPGCRGYAPVFERRVTRPLVSAFGFDRDSFAQAGMSLLGMEQGFGNSSFKLSVLPRVPITFVLWEGDQDFPPSLRVLFDRSIDTYLPLEDIVVVSKMAATRILKYAQRHRGFSES